MRRLIHAAALTALVLFLAGCAGKKDTITFHQDNPALPNTQAVSYELDLENTVGGASVTVQLWENGTCAESESLTLDRDNKKLSCLFTLDSSLADTTTPGITVQMDSDESSDLFLAQFTLPQNIRGYAFTGYTDNEELEVHLEENMVLCAMAFDTGSGVRTVDCRSLTQDPEKVKEYSCILLVQADFTAE